MDISSFHPVNYRFESKTYKLNFDFNIWSFHKKKRRGRRFEFHETLLKFLSKNPGKAIYVTQSIFDDNGFEINGNNIFLNINEFQRFCFGLDPRIDRADAFFRQDVNIENITLTWAKEDQILEWIQQLSDDDKDKFLEKIWSNLSLGSISDTYLFDEINKRGLSIDNIKYIVSNATRNTDDISILQEFSVWIDVRKFELVLDIWNKNKKNKNEEFWQGIFQEHSWILSQVFSAPVVFLKWKPYCGWKSPDNEGWVYSDFRFETLKTWTSVFIEIKTPLSKIINKQYRWKDDWDTNLVYSMWDEVTGGTVQLINQRQTAIAEYEKNNQLKIRNSKWILVLWSTEEMTDNQKKLYY